MHHWAGRKPDPEGSFGFIYIITNLTNGRKYLGKKQYNFYKKVRRKGKKRRETVSYPSGWETYTGSSTELNADIDRLGKENFSFKILKNYSTRGGLYYAEVHYLVTKKCLWETDKDGNRLWYNGQIPSVKFRPRELP